MKKIVLLLLALAALLCFASCVKESPEPLVDFDALKEGPRKVVSTEDLNGYTFRVYSDDTAELCAVDEEKFTKVLTLPEFYEDYPIVGIEDEVFLDTSFTTVILTEKLQRIGARAFQNSAITDIVIPDSVTELGEDVFENCLKLERVTFGAGLKEIPMGVCFSCPKLKTVKMAPTVTAIGEEAFGDCGLLTEIELPASLETVGPYAFWRTGLTSLRVPQSVKTVGVSAFRQTPWLSEQCEEWVLVGDFVLIHYNGAETSVTIPEEVKYLSDAFAGQSLGVLTLPDTLEGIAEGALDEVQLSDVVYNKDNPILSAYFAIPSSYLREGGAEA